MARECEYRLINSFFLFLLFFSSISISFILLILFIYFLSDISTHTRREYSSFERPYDHQKFEF